MDGMVLLGLGLSTLVGLTLGLIGAGGSILTVPILYYVLGVGAEEATGMSLFIVGLTALVAALFYARRGEIAWKEGFLFALPSFLSVFLTRSLLVPVLPTSFSLAGFVLTKDALILLVFAALMVAAGVAMVRKGRPSASEEPSAQGGTEGKPRMLFADAPLKRAGLITLEGLAVGAVTGFVGAGGGFLIVPALVLIVGLPMKIAVGTSLMIIALKSLVGFLGDLSSGSVEQWGLMFAVSGLALAGMAAGLLLSKRISAEGLKPAFGWFVLAMAVVLLLKEGAALF